MDKEEVVQDALRHGTQIRESQSWTHYVGQKVMQQYSLWQDMQTVGMNVDFRDLLNSLVDSLDRTYTERWQEYTDQGVPYGCNEQGLWKWMQEVDARESQDEDESTNEG